MLVALQGRYGRGSLYVWAAGNGAKNGDSCVTDGYASSIYTIAVGSADIYGAPAYYDEKCSSKLVVVYNHGNTNLSHSVSHAGLVIVHRFMLVLLSKRLQQYLERSVPSRSLVQVLPLHFLLELWL